MSEPHAGSTPEELEIDDLTGRLGAAQRENLGLREELGRASEYVQDLEGRLLDAYAACDELRARLAAQREITTLLKEREA